MRLVRESSGAGMRPPRGTSRPGILGSLGRRKPVAFMVRRSAMVACTITINPPTTNPATIKTRPHVSVRYTAESSFSPSVLYRSPIENTAKHLWSRAVHCVSHLKRMELQRAASTHAVSDTCCNQ